MTCQSWWGKNNGWNFEIKTTKGETLKLNEQRVKLKLKDKYQYDEGLLSIIIWNLYGAFNTGSWTSMLILISFVDVIVIIFL